MSDDSLRLPTLAVGQLPTEEHIRVFEAWLREHPQPAGTFTRTAAFYNQAVDWWNAGAPDADHQSRFYTRTGDAYAEAQMPDFPAGQTAAERVAAIAKAAGFGEPQRIIEVTYATSKCRVFWGSHGCQHPRGHGSEVPHECDCCECGNHPDDLSCVAKPPYYGPDTRFYGEDAEALGLPLVDSDA